MRKLTTILLILQAVNTTSAQSKWESCSSKEFSQAIIAVEELVMDKSSYSYETDYLFFEQAENGTPIIQDKALLICLNGEEFYIEQFGKVIIQDNLVQLEIDPAYKTIVLRDPLEDYTKRKTSSDFAALDMPGAQVKKKTSGSKKQFYITFPDGQLYVGAEVTLGGAMGIEKYVLYSKATTLENEDGTSVSAQPRMEVTYKNFIQGSQVKTDRMKRTTHYLAIKGGNYMLNEEYNEYELIDLRSQPE